MGVCLVRERKEGRKELALRACVRVEELWHLCRLRKGWRFSVKR